MEIKYILGFQSLLSFVLRISHCISMKYYATLFSIFLYVLGLVHKLFMDDQREELWFIGEPQNIILLKSIFTVYYDLFKINIIKVLCSERIFNIALYYFKLALLSGFTRVLKKWIRLRIFVFEDRVLRLKGFLRGL